MLKDLEERLDRMSEQMWNLIREAELKLKTLVLKNSMSEINHMGLKKDWTVHKKIFMNLKTSQ